MKLLEKVWAWHAARPCEAIIGPGHKYVDMHGGRWLDELRNTGQFIDGKPIQEKYSVLRKQCTRCKDISTVEFKERY